MTSRTDWLMLSYSLAVNFMIWFPTKKLTKFGDWLNVYPSVTTTC